MSAHYCCSYNNLKSLRGIAHKIGGDIYCADNKLPVTDIKRARYAYEAKDSLLEVCNVLQREH